jgi:hypothetical protein
MERAVRFVPATSLILKEQRALIENSDIGSIC